MLRTMQRVIDMLVEWGKERGLEFNPAKTVVVLFGRGREKPPFTLDVGDSEVQFMVCVTLNRKLAWTNHIKDKLCKGKKLLNLLRNVTLKNWGPYPNTNTNTGLILELSVPWSHTRRSVGLTLPKRSPSKRIF